MAAVSTVTEAPLPPQVAAASLAAGSFAHQLDEKIQDEFDAVGVNDEMLSVWERMPLVLHHGESRWPEGVRILAVQTIMGMVVLLGMEKTICFDTVMLLDVYVERCESPQLRTLPKLCDVLVRTVCKVKDHDACYFGHSLVPLLSELAMQLKALGFDEACGDLSADEAKKLELDLLQTLNWQMKLPTLETYLNTFCTRLDLLTQGVIRSSTSWIWHRSMDIAWAMLMGRSTAEGQHPRQVATGIFALCVAAARLLPLQALCPAGVSSEEWQTLCLASQVLGTCQPCYLTGKDTRVTEWLVTATAWDMSKLQEASRVVIESFSGI